MNWQILQSLKIQSTGKRETMGVLSDCWGVRVRTLANGVSLCIPVKTHTKRSNTSSITDPDRTEPDVHRRQNDKSTEADAFSECESERQPRATTQRSVTTTNYDAYVQGDFIM